MSNVGLSLGAVPKSLSDELFERYKEVERNFREHRWEPSELNGGKLCEVAYTILRGYIDNNYPSIASKPSNFADACRALEKEPNSVSRSVKIQIPRILIALYEIRNNRGVGHVGGDVNPNQMDALCVLQMAKWIVSELIRIFHNISTNEAEKIIETISERKISLIWETGTVKRVLDNKLTMLQKTLVILYSSSDSYFERDLFENLEHSNISVYRRDILKNAHKNRLLEYNSSTKLVTISPLGVRMVEEEIIPKSEI